MAVAGVGSCNCLVFPLPGVVLMVGLVVSVTMTVVDVSDVVRGWW